MDVQAAFAIALRRVRKSRKMTQEDFDQVSSRTYLSMLERGLKSPTLNKLEELAQAMQIHPLTLLLVTYVEQNPDVPARELVQLVLEEFYQFDTPHGHQLAK